MSKCCLPAYYFAVERELSLSLKAFFRFIRYWFKAYSCWAATIAFICATSPKGVVMNELNIFGSVRMFWLRVIGSFVLRSYA
jgi:hypothetical protein